MNAFAMKEIEKLDGLRNKFGEDVFPKSNLLYHDPEILVCINQQLEEGFLSAHTE